MIKKGVFIEYMLHDVLHFIETQTSYTGKRCLWKASTFALKPIKVSQEDTITAPTLRSDEAAVNKK